jgi:hypothetical protein
MLHIVSDAGQRERSVGDESTAFLSIEGDPGSTTIVFLPWCMPYRLAMARRIVPENYLTCYEMPPAIVSSEPETCILALHAVVDDATRNFHRSRLTPDQVLVVGLSIGNAAATMFANRIGARLCSVASADRGDLTLWESPASRHVKARAEEKGYRVSDFTRVLEGHHTIDHLDNLAPGSRFVIGLQDELLPEARREGLVAAVTQRVPGAEIIRIDSTHFGTMRETIRRGLCLPAQIPRARACRA